MKKYPGLLFSLCLLTACSNSPIKISSASPPPEIPWRFMQLQTSIVEEGTRVHGHLIGNRDLTLPTGHIDIVAYASDGSLLDRTTVTYPFRLPYSKRGRGHGAHFSALLKTLPPDATVQVSFHPQKEGEPDHIIERENKQ